MKQIKLKKLDEMIFYDCCSNGLEIYIWVNKKVNTFKGTYTVKCGAEHTHFSLSKKEYQLPHGVAHYLEHIMCKNEDGSPLLGSFHELGSYSNAATYPDKTIYEFVGSENLKENLELLLDSVQFKKFQEEYFESERGPILEEARMKKDQVPVLAHFGINHCLFWNYPNRTIGLGTKEDIESMTLEDLKLFYETFYHPKNSFVVVTGNVDPYEVVHTIKENQKKKEFPPYIEPTLKKYKEPRRVVTKFQEEFCNVEMPIVYLSSKIPVRNFQVDEISLLDMVGVVLSSNFGVTSFFREKLLEDHLAVSLSTSAYVERDYLIIQVMARTKYPEELIPLLKEKLEHLEFLEKDIQRKIKSEIANLVLGYEDPENVNDFLNYSLVRYGKVIDNEKDILESITMEQIKTIFSKIHFKEMNVFLLKPRKDEL